MFTNAQFGWLLTLCLAAWGLSAKSAEELILQKKSVIKELSSLDVEVIWLEESQKLGLTNPAVAPRMANHEVLTFVREKVEFRAELVKKKRGAAPTMADTAKRLGVAYPVQEPTLFPQDLEREATAQVARKLMERFPDQMIKDFIAQADEKFKVCEVGTIVEFKTYRYGKIRGVYRGVQSNMIVVDQKRFTLDDLEPGEAVRFSQSMAAKEKADYINRGKTQLESKKREYSEKIRPIILNELYQKTGAYTKVGNIWVETKVLVEQEYEAERQKFLTLLNQELEVERNAAEKDAQNALLALGYVHAADTGLYLPCYDTVLKNTHKRIFDELFTQATQFSPSEGAVYAEKAIALFAEGSDYRGKLQLLITELKSRAAGLAAMTQPQDPTQMSQIENGCKGVIESWLTALKEGNDAAVYWKHSGLALKFNSVVGWSIGGPDGGSWSDSLNGIVVDIKTRGETGNEVFNRWLVWVSRQDTVWKINMIVKQQ